MNLKIERDDRVVTVTLHRPHVHNALNRELMTELVDTTRDHGFHSMIARIVSSNAASIALHRAVGFEIVGVEKEVGRKLGRWLDVVVMQRMLGGR